MKELRKQIAALRAKLQGFQSEIATASEERLGEIETETRTAKADLLSLTEKLRAGMAAEFERGIVEEPNLNENSDPTIARMSKRDKMAFVLGRQARRKPFTETEKRALGSALTTTSDTFVSATAEVDGINNAGILIPTLAVLEFLREDGKLSPLFKDIVFTAIPGLVDFPFRKSRDKAKAKAEAAVGLDNQFEWDKLTGIKGYLQTIIGVTDEVNALTDFDFGAYIMDQILQDLNEDWINSLIYGTGANDLIKGITVGATAAVTGGYAAGKATEAIVAGLKKLTGKFRRNAKIYVAQDVADDILFALDDNGNFKFPVFNNSTGITSFGTARLEVDENLNAGEFVIGNVGKFFKVNSLIPIRIETNRLARKAITEYIASEFCASVPYPGAFVHGTKA